MSLVAYIASSDEDSDFDESAEETNAAPIVSAIILNNTQNSTSNAQQSGQSTQVSSKSLNLPQPKHQIAGDATSGKDIETDDFELNLPAPKKSQKFIEEEDDEFLRKKVQPSQNPKVRKPVKITIPSLAELGDDDLPKGKLVSVGANPVKPNSLLGMLPPPKFDGVFGKPKEKPDTNLSSSSSSSSSSSTSKPIVTKTTSLVPHAVANKLKQTATKPQPSKVNLASKKSNLGLNYNNSDNSDNEDDETGDFFSLNADEKLPEVSASELNAMIAKKAAQMAAFSNNLKQTEQQSMETIESDAQPSSSYASDRDNINIEALIGARAAKRSRKKEIQFIDISQDQVTSSQDEWARNQLQSETQYQPTGHLVVGDPGAGTKKKHQITYLAYQAKANEAELQAMWATNRASRRQTQSKYGF